MSTDGTTHDESAPRDAAAATSAAHGEAADDGAAAPATGTTAAQDAAEGTDARSSVRIGTVVWGLIVAVLGAGVLAVAAGYTVDVELAAIILLIAGGAGLILGPLLQGLRRGRGRTV